jgi:hypothetical protein
MATSTPPFATRNQLLAALPPGVLSRLLDRMRPFSLTTRDSLIAPNRQIEAALSH